MSQLLPDIIRMRKIVHFQQSITHESGSTLCPRKRKLSNTGQLGHSSISSSDDWQQHEKQRAWTNKQRAAAGTLSRNSSSTFASAAASSSISSYTAASGTASAPLVADDDVQPLAHAAHCVTASAAQKAARKATLLRPSQQASPTG